MKPGCPSILASFARMDGMDGMDADRITASLHNPTHEGISAQAIVLKGRDFSPTVTAILATRLYSKS
jgi:hypothetical protein